MDSAEVAAKLAAALSEVFALPPLIDIMVQYYGPIYEYGHAALLFALYHIQARSPSGSYWNTVTEYVNADPRIYRVGVREIRISYTRVIDVFVNEHREGIRFAVSNVGGPPRWKIQDGISPPAGWLPCEVHRCIACAKHYQGKFRKTCGIRWIAADDLQINDINARAIRLFAQTRSFLGGRADAIAGVRNVLFNKSAVHNVLLIHTASGDLIIIFNCGGIGREALCYSPIEQYTSNTMRAIATRVT